MDDVEFINNYYRRSEFSETVGYGRSSTLTDALDLALPSACTDERVRPLERLRERWTFQSMPQDVNLAAYGEQFTGGWPSFPAQVSSCKDEKPSCKDGKPSSAQSPSRTFAEKCVAYAGSVFSWNFCWTACMYLQQIVGFHNRC